MAMILTREHPQWDQFIQILEGIVYFHEIENKDGEPDIAWHCESDFTQTTAVLNFMISLGILKDIDIDGTIEYFQENGGYCDCEVLFNVDDDNDEDDNDEDDNDEDDNDEDDNDEDDDDEDDDDDDDTPLEEDKDFEEFRIHQELPARVLGTGTYIDEYGNGTFEIQIDSFNGARVIMRQNDNDDTEVTHYLMPDDMVTAILNKVRRDQPIEFTVNNVNRPALNDVDPSDIFEM